MKNKQAGFTLVEIAIVLVIIGLLLGGVLKGQELINSAKVKNIVGELKSVSTFAYAYQDRFRALPGDDGTPATHVNTGQLATTPAAPAARGNGLIEGAWNSVTTTDESYLFWQHVRLANLATGSTAFATPADYVPRNAEGGRIGVTSVTPVTGMRGTLFVCTGNLNGRIAQQVDSQLDDGLPASGVVQVLLGGEIAGPAAPIANNLVPLNEGVLHTVCVGF
jgi:prepilin-type N-terminal cleavage/methylation domain-containing protein